MEKVEKTVVRFGFDKTTIGAKYRPVVREVARTLKDCKAQTVTVDGYTDATGSALYNKWLSQQRADAGVRALIRHGVEKSRLTAVGHGAENPVGSNKTRSGRAKNRRVEFHAGAGVAGRVVPVATETVTTVKEAAGVSPSGSWWDSLNTMLNTSRTASATVVSGTEE